MALLANDVLNWVSFVLIEQFVNVLCPWTIAPGVAIITPSSMTGIYNGALLMVGAGASLEVVTVSAVTATTFTATFANAHVANEPLVGATFPSGQTDNPLFTQAEMLGYLFDVQNDFLVKVQQAVYNVATVNFTTGKRIYPAPADAIRMERVSIAGAQLFDVSQTSLDLQDSYWESAAQTTPKAWYQDKLNNALFGFSPTPGVGGSASTWYSQRGPVAMTLSSTFLLPDPLLMYIKYGVLARCFDKDGELRDPNRAKYCQSRYALGVQIVVRFLIGAMAAMNPKEMAGL